MFFEVTRIINKHTDHERVQRMMVNSAQVDAIYEGDEHHPTYIEYKGDGLNVRESYDWVKAHLPKSVIMTSSERMQKLEQGKYPKGVDE